MERRHQSARGGTGGRAGPRERAIRRAREPGNARSRSGRAVPGRSGRASEPRDGSARRVRRRRDRGGGGAPAAARGRRRAVARRGVARVAARSRARLRAAALLEAVAGGDRLAPDAPAWPSAARTLIDSLPGSLPPAVVGAVCLRFRALPLSAQQVLGAAAALGGRGDVERLARATALE